MNLFLRKSGALRHKHFKRILIVHPFGIGDALFMTPMIRALHHAGMEKIDLLLGSRTKALFDHHPFVRGVYEWDRSPTRGFWEMCQRTLDIVRLLFRLLLNRYSLLIDCSLQHQYSFLAWILLWIPIRIGFDFKDRGFFLTHSIDLPNAFHEKPAPEYYSELLSLLGIEPTKTPLELFLSQDDEDQAQKALRDLGIGEQDFFFVVAPGGGESWGRDARLKRWPTNYFAALMDRLYDFDPHRFGTVLILGGPNEKSIGEELLKKVKGPTAHDVCGAYSIRVVAALIKRANLFIGNDGGLVHVASAMGTPLVALYGPVDPRVYGPYFNSGASLAVTHTGPACRPCYQNLRYQADCVGVECLNELTPERVLEQMRSANFLEQLSHQVTR